MFLRLIRLFTLIVTFVCISSATFAISLGELQNKVYTVDKKENFIAEGEAIADYDYNKSIEGIIKRNNLSKVPYTSEKVKSTVKKAKLKDSGVVNSLKFSAIYDFNGNVIYSGDSIEAFKKEKVDATSSGYVISVKAFKKYYNVKF